jgi:uncharacterized paraquat-inducible protein A
MSAQPVAASLLRIGIRWGDQFRVRCPRCATFMAGVENATCSRCGTTYAQSEPGSLHYRVVL